MRPALATIDLAAFRYNYLLARELSNAKTIAVIKADAYGHGAVQCARALADVADGFAVACIEEAVILREAGIQNSILLLEGFFHTDELELISELDLWLVVHADWQVKILLASPISSKLKIWLKMDSGMHRVGLMPHEYKKAYHVLKQLPWIDEIILMTHLACADDVSFNNSRQQVELFLSEVRTFPNHISFKNSAAILSLQDIASDWTRSGIMLYGASPVDNLFAEQLKPVMKLETQIISIRDIKQGEAVGYGANFIAPHDMRVGVAAIGYADGYPRHAASGTPVAIDGELSTIIGRVSMDMLSVDLTHFPKTNIGSKVQLWGDVIAANVVANYANTIAYQLFCNLKRTNKEYIF